MSKKTFLLSLILSALALTLSACTLPWPKNGAPGADTTPVVGGAAVTTVEEIPATATGKLKKFNNYDELAEFLVANNSAAAAAVTSDSDKPNNSFDYSSLTDNSGAFDKADIIKTDGHYIYALVRNELSIINASPSAEAKVMSKIIFKSRPEGLFISGNSLMVFGNDTNIASQDIYSNFKRRNPYVFVKIFDVNDPANPKQTRDLDFEGSYYDARLAGDYIYLVTDTYNSYVAGEPVLPRLIDNGQVLPSECEVNGKCFAPDIFYFDIAYDTYHFINIAAINIKNSAEPVGGQAYLLNSGQNVYMSENNLYITYVPYLDKYNLEQAAKKELIYPRLSGDDQGRINAIEATPAFILSAAAKLVKESPYLNRYLNSLAEADRTTLNTDIQTLLTKKINEQAGGADKTIIHKIGLAGGKMPYLAMGEVSGQLLNNFSLNESGGYFRLATRRSQYSPRLTESASDSYTSIYVLDAGLVTVGKLENLATTEKIYAARFIGNRVYLVTLRAADPLFAIGLSDPAKPTVLGALTMPGLLNYLYPLDADGAKLLSLGHEAATATDGSATPAALKLSLFDFSDLAKPKELDSYILGVAGSDSIAIYDHQALLYLAAQNLLMIPAALRDSSGGLNFAGALAFTLKDNSLTLRGQIDHSAGGHYGTADTWGSYNYYDNTVKRSFYINGSLFTFSNKFLKINNLNDAAAIKSLELTVGGDDFAAPALSATSTPSETSSPALETSAAPITGVTADTPIDTQVPLDNTEVPTPVPGI